MKQRSCKTLVASVLTLTMCAALAACTTTQTPKKQLDDNAIHAAVKARLTTARFSNIVNIDINVTNGVVTLAGEVPNVRVKDDAADEARKVDGVVRVNNNLQVKTPQSS
jgi:osmotically-inducible protein OsmY